MWGRLNSRTALVLNGVSIDLRELLPKLEYAVRPHFRHNAKRILMLRSPFLWLERVHFAV